MNTLYLKRLIVGLVGLGLLVPAGLVFRHFQVDLARARQRIAGGGKVIQTDCGPIQYTEFGTGAPMLMIHGAGGGYDQGETFARLIGGNYRWIIPSRFGFLDTPAPQDATSEMQADAHACLLDALGIDRVGVVGASGGGPSALLFARRYPQRAHSLVMIAAVSHSMPVRPAAVRALFSAFTNDFVFWSLIHTNREGLLAALGVPAEDQKALSARELSDAFAFIDTILPMSDRKAGQELEQQMSEYDAQQIRQIETPTLVVHARNDALVAFDQGEFTAQMVPGAEFIPLDKGGHLALMFESNADALNKVRQFVEAHSP